MAIVAPESRSHSILVEWVGVLKDRSFVGQFLELEENQQKEIRKKLEQI